MKLITAPCESGGRILGDNRAAEPGEVTLADRPIADQEEADLSPPNRPWLEQLAAYDGASWYRRTRRGIDRAEAVDLLMVSESFS